MQVVTIASLIHTLHGTNTAGTSAVNPCKLPAVVGLFEGSEHSIDSVAQYTDCHKLHA